MTIDNYLSEKYIELLRKKPYVQSIMFHKIFRNRGEIIPENGDPLEAIDINQFETFVKFFSKRSVEFINENDILKGNLDSNRQYIFLTFDDGYFNNFYCLDILEKYKIKATFMISTNHIKSNKAFWWDITHREIWKKNNSLPIHIVNEKIREVNSKLYNMKWRDQEGFIKEYFGVNCLQTKNDLDRPMTASELSQFVKHPYVSLGNHTHNHINMTLYNDEELTESLLLADEFLTTVTSQKITSISYPHGWFNEHTIRTVNQLGYKIGVTTNPGKNYVSQINNKQDLLKLNRITLLGNLNIEDQCRRIHTDFSLLSALKKSIQG